MKNTWLGSGKDHVLDTTWLEILPSTLQMLKCHFERWFLTQEPAFPNVLLPPSPQPPPQASVSSWSCERKTTHIVDMWIGHWAIWMYPRFSETYNTKNSILMTGLLKPSCTDCSQILKHKCMNPLVGGGYFSRCALTFASKWKLSNQCWSKHLSD